MRYHGEKGNPKGKCALSKTCGHSVCRWIEQFHKIGVVSKI